MIVRWWLLGALLGGLGSHARNPYQQQQRDVFVHTFDTREMCMVRCRLPCSQQHSEDLMMPRWYCPLQEESEGAWEGDNSGDATSLLIVVIPLSILGAVLFLCALAACTSRVLRNS